MNYEVVSLEERFDLFEIQDNMNTGVWPEFILQDSFIDKYWMQMIEYFKSYQLMIMDNDEILAAMTTVPLRFDGDMCDLADEGWNWGIEKSIADYHNKITPNMLMAVQIVVNNKYQNKGISASALKETKKLATQKGFDTLIAPVRPTGKCEYPLADIDEYIKRMNHDGLPLDNWVRSHCKVGGTIIKICYKSMQISGSIADWEKWTNQTFPASGDYLIDGALNPISINKEDNLGIYIEPNVWILHNISK